MAAALARWQDGVRVEQKRRLRDAGVETSGFVEDGEDGAEEEGLAGMAVGEQGREDRGVEDDGPMEKVNE